MSRGTCPTGQGCTPCPSFLSIFPYGVKQAKKRPLCPQNIFSRHTPARFRFELLATSGGLSRVVAWAVQIHKLEAGSQLHLARSAFHFSRDTPSVEPKANKQPPPAIEGAGWCKVLALYLSCLQNM